MKKINGKIKVWKDKPTVKKKMDCGTCAHKGRSKCPNCEYTKEDPSYEYEIRAKRQQQSIESEPTETEKHARKFLDEYDHKKAVESGKNGARLQRERLEELIKRLNLPQPPPRKQEAYILTNGRETEEYREWRLAVLVRDKSRCVFCASMRLVQVHHIIRWIDAPELRYEIKNGASLCKKCHEEHHGIYNLPFKQEITDKLVAYVRCCNA